MRAMAGVHFCLGTLFVFGLVVSAVAVGTGDVVEDAVAVAAGGVVVVPVPCSAVHPFQRICDDSEDEAVGQRICHSVNRTMNVTCRVVDGVDCDGPRVFTLPTPNGYSFEVAMALSALFGFFGFDRCYLGYPTLGFVKFITCGGFVVWTVVDLVLVATQLLGPYDGSAYEFTSSIPRLTKLIPTNHSAFP